MKPACMFTSCLCLQKESNTSCCVLSPSQKRSRGSSESIFSSARRRERALVVVQTHTHTLIPTGTVPMTALENAVKWRRTEHNTSHK